MVYTVHQCKKVGCNNAAILIILKSNAVKPKDHNNFPMVASNVEKN